METERTEISSLGEFGLIDHLTKNFETQNASTIVSVGDDAAVIDHFGKQTEITKPFCAAEVSPPIRSTPYFSQAKCTPS